MTITFAIPASPNAHPTTRFVVVDWPVVPRVGERVGLYDPHYPAQNDGYLTRFVVAAVEYAPSMRELRVPEVVIVPEAGCTIRVELARLP